MNEDNPLDWAFKADGDLDMAGRALRGKVKHADSASYHAQQCAEKYFKAMLVAQGAKFPKSHDLVSLNNLCVTSGVFTNFDTEKLDYLSGFAIGTRYPGMEPSLEEARNAIEIAKTIRKFARKWLGVK